MHRAPICCWPPAKLILGAWLLASMLGACGARPPVGAAASQAPLIGRVVGADGRGVGGVEVTAYFTNATPLTFVMAYRVSAAKTMEQTTGPDGRFAFSSPPDGPLNLEAVASDALKAIRLDIPIQPGVRMDIGDLHLVPTGTLVGRVTAPEAPQVTDFLGTDVYIPGTGYLAKTDNAGHFTLTHVAAGTMPLVADNPDLGRAVDPAVVIQPGQTTSAADLAMSLVVPMIASLTPPAGAPGSVITIDGSNFGLTSGKPFSVNFNGLVATQVTRVSDTRLLATIPPGAGSGRVVVTVGAVPSASNVSLTVLKDLSLAPAGPLLVPPGSSLALTVSGTDTSGAAVANPAVVWSSSDPASVSVDTAGNLSAKALGEVRLTVTSGSLSRSALVEVSPVQGLPLSLGSGSPESPLCEAGSGQGVLFLWSMSEAGDSARFQGQLVNPDGSLPGTALPLSDLATAPAHAIFALGARSDGYQVVFAQPDASGSFDLGSQRLNLDGTAATGLQILATGSDGLDGLATVQNPSGQGLIIWQAPDGRLWSRWLTGTPVSWALDPTTASQSAGVLAWDGTRFLLAWQDGRNGNPDIYACSLMPGASPSPSIPICEEPAQQLTPAIAAANGHALVVWCDRRSGHGVIWARPLLAGQPTGASQPIDGVAGESHPTVTWTGKAFLVAWLDTRLGTASIFGQLVGLEGQPLSPACALELAGTSVTDPLLCPLGASELLGWRDAGGGFFAQRILFP